MKLAIADALESKKFLAFLATLIVVIGNKCVGHWGYELDASQVALLVGSAATYMLGQGIADHGKTAADTNAAVAAAIAMPDGAEKTAALALFHGALTPITPSNTTVPKQAQAGFARLGLMIALAAIGATLLFGCGASANFDTRIQTVVTGVTYAQLAANQFDTQHEKDIALSCGNGITDPVAAKADCTTKVAAYRAELKKFNEAFDAAVAAIKAVVKLKNDQTVAGAEAAALIVAQELAALGVKL